MKKIIVLLFVLFLTSGCILPGKAKEPTLDQLTRVDVIDEYKHLEVIFGGEEEIGELIELFQKIEWEEGEAKQSREPDMTLNIFFTVEEGMPDSIRQYQVWFISDQSISFADSHNSRIGMLKGKDAKKLQELINKKINHVHEWSE